MVCHDTAYVQANEMDQFYEFHISRSCIKVKVKHKKVYFSYLRHVCVIVLEQRGLTMHCCIKFFYC